MRSNLLSVILFGLMVNMAACCKHEHLRNDSFSTMIVENATQQGVRTVRFNDKMVKSEQLGIIDTTILYGCDFSLKANGDFMVSPKEMTLIKYIEPIYPMPAIAMGLDGTVRMRIKVNPDGSVFSTDILSSRNALFDQPSTAATTAWRFSEANHSSNVRCCEVTISFIRVKNPKIMMK
jgi:TonB family protein